MVQDYERFRSDLLYLRQKFEAARVEYARANNGDAVAAMFIQVGRRDVESAEAVNDWLAEKSLKPQGHEEVWYHDRFGLDRDPQRRAGPSVYAP